MDWLKAMGSWVWSALALLVGGAIFAQFALPLFQWFWGFAATNAQTLIALAIIAAVAGLVEHNHNHKDKSTPSD